MPIASAGWIEQITAKLRKTQIPLGWQTSPVKDSVATLDSSCMHGAALAQPDCVEAKLVLYGHRRAEVSRHTIALPGRDGNAIPVLFFPWFYLPQTMETMVRDGIGTCRRTCWQCTGSWRTSLIGPMDSAAVTGKLHKTPYLDVHCQYCKIRPNRSRYNSRRPYGIV